jgi:hypothetical protein
MLALFLWYAFGWRFGLAEIFAEIAVAAVLLGGGGGGRIFRTVRVLWRLPLPSRGGRTI